MLDADPMIYDATEMNIQVSYFFAGFAVKMFCGFIFTLMDVQ